MTSTTTLLYRSILYLSTALVVLGISRGEYQGCCLGLV